MAIKSYRFYVSQSGGGVEYPIIKATGPKDANRKIEQLFPEADWIGSPERVNRSQRNESPLDDVAVPKKTRARIRGGRYIYKHKGHKPRGRKNYPDPRGGWRKFVEFDPHATFTYIENYGQRISNFFRDWIGSLDNSSRSPDTANFAKD